MALELFQIKTAFTKENFTTIEFMGWVFITTREKGSSIMEVFRTVLCKEREDSILKGKRLMMDNGREACITEKV